MVRGADRPVVGTVIGDPAGIGPEVVAMALASGRVHDCSVPLLIGSAAAMERALEATGGTARLRVMHKLEALSDDPAIIDILDTGRAGALLPPLGADSELAGEASAQWLDEMDRLARDGSIAATVLAPISTGSLKLVGKLGKVISPAPGETYLVLVTGPLRVAHLTDHMSLRQVCDRITQDLVLQALRQLDSEMKDWGLPGRRIAVAGLNPHAMGEEEARAIAPAVQIARGEGINVTGPESPDAVFRHCIEGRCDMVLAMYHDQGHIAVKTWGFSGNSVIMAGAPYIHVSVAHGTAYDIAGTGRADPAMMLNAMRLAGSLALGAGIPEDV